MAITILTKTHNFKKIPGLDTQIQAIIKAINSNTWRPSLSRQSDYVVLKDLSKGEPVNEYPPSGIGWVYMHDGEIWGKIPTGGDHFAEIKLVPLEIPYITLEGQISDPPAPSSDDDAILYFYGGDNTMRFNNNITGVKVLVTELPTT